MFLCFGVAIINGIVHDIAGLFGVLDVGVAHVLVAGEDHEFASLEVKLGNVEALGGLGDRGGRFVRVVRAGGLAVVTSGFTAGSEQ